jgi:hypothetical protein
MKFFQISIPFCLFNFFFFSVVVAQDFSQNPTEVQNVEAVAGDTMIDLIWDEADDPDGVVTGYKVYYGTQPVQTEGDSYADEITIGNKTTYSLKNLTNGTEYFLAITAVDDEGNESSTYSVEVSARPLAPEIQSLKVLSSEQLSNTEVNVIMSEEVQLLDFSSAFLVENANTLKETPILGLSLNGEKVLLSFEEGILIPGETYRIIATSSVEDLNGNPVASGITDTVEFEARNIIPPPPPSSSEELSLELSEEAKSIVSPDSYNEQSSGENNSQSKESIHSSATENNSFSEPDLFPPMDGTELQIDTSALESENLVFLHWTPALDVDDDIADQVLYTREGLGDWDNGYSLGKDTSEVELEVDLDQNYEIRLVTVDTSQNESSGVELSFSTHLTETGPGEVGTVIGLAILFFVGLIFLGKRRTAY